MNGTITDPSVPLFTLNPNHELVIIGTVYIVLASGNIPVYAFIIYVLTTDRELSANPQYRLMNQISVVDSAQSLFHMLSGFFIIFPQIQIEWQGFVRVCGTTLNSLWLALFPLMVVLSINRILVICNAVMLLGWLYIIGIWLYGCITQNMTLDGVGWGYDFSKVGSDTLSALEWYFCFPSLLVTYIAYLAIVIRLKMVGLRKNRESRILVQATLLCSYMSTLIVFWHNAGTKFKTCFANYMYFSIITAYSTMCPPPSEPRRIGMNLRNRTTSRHFSLMRLDSSRF
ncbi:unnamed protein product [Nippostrongylus brasiliensis]|uniref:G_PROTEIN_RECEP_F1_2 domain-containing protein n=1 Tax=Nippostrongylus brasiliensis TaxID=27835 RepID=A0A0N4XCE2_NIPBR|nr:unnamed protein product [Nippostrongylus brasiliensis]